MPPSTPLPLSLLFPPPKPPADLTQSQQPLLVFSFAVYTRAPDSAYFFPKIFFLLFFEPANFSTCLLVTAALGAHLLSGLVPVREFCILVLGLLIPVLEFLLLVHGFLILVLGFLVPVLKFLMIADLLPSMVRAGILVPAPGFAGLLPHGVKAGFHAALPLGVDAGFHVQGRPLRFPRLIPGIRLSLLRRWLMFSNGSKPPSPPRERVLPLSPPAWIVSGKPSSDFALGFFALY